MGFQEEAAANTNIGPDVQKDVVAVVFESSYAYFAIVSVESTSARIVDYQEPTVNHKLIAVTKRCGI